MYSFRLWCLSFLLIALILTPVRSLRAQKTSEVQESYCLNNSMAAIQKSIEDYSTHHLFDDQQADDFLWITYVKMHSSQKTTLAEGTAVSYKLKPYGVDDEKDQPRFTLLCNSESRYFLQDLEYTFTCELLKDKPMDWPHPTLETYGVQSFDLKILAKNTKTTCLGLKPSTLVNISATIVTDSEDVESIKRKVAKTKVLKPMIDAIFDEEQFFANYYRKFFAGWKKRIPLYEEKK